MSSRIAHVLSISTLTIGFALIAPVLRAQGGAYDASPHQAEDRLTGGVRASCSMAGTWFGGGDAAKYLAVITPGASNDFNLVFDGAYSLTTLGFPVKTIWSGSIVRTNTTFDLYAIGMTNASTGFPAPTPDVWAVHAKVRLTDCNTLHIDYDFFGAYYWSSNKTPFVDLPDYVVAPPPFSETYKRMPTTCQQCGRL